MKPTFLLVALLLCFTASGQTGLILEYDLFENEVKYFKNGKEITTPRIESGQNLKVVLKEFNPYISRANIQVQNINYSQGTTAMGSVSMDGGSSGFLGGISGLLGGFGAGGEMGSIFSGIPGSRGVSEKKVRTIKSNYKSLTQELAQVEERLNKSYEKIKLFKQAEESKKVALRDVQTLTNNTMIKPSRIKAMLLTEIRHAFAKREDEDIEIEDLVDKSKAVNELKSNIESYQSATADYVKLSGEFNNMNLELSSITADDDDQLEFIQNSTQDLLGTMEQNIDSFEKMQFDVSEEDVITLTNVDDMTYLRQVYEELLNGKFEYSFAPIQAEGDEIVLEVDVQQRDETGTFVPFRFFKQTVPVTSGWKISGSLGLCFGKFKEEQFRYYINEETLVADKKDEFIPLVASFVHFTRRTHLNYSVGASFGIGLPMVGGDNIQSASFFAGPTLVLGRNQKFMLTTGLMGAKAERLSGGLEVGDMYTNEGGFIPTSQNYELGYFLGISFSIVQ